MNSYARFALVFFSTYLGFVAINAAFAAQLTIYAVTSCAQKPHFFCSIFDIVHKWYWLATPALAALLAFVITLTVKRGAA